MKELYDATRLVILSNYGSELNEAVLDVITVACLSLFIKDLELTKERLPDILKKIDIIFGEEKVTDMILKKYPEYPKNNATDSDSAMVVRAMNFDGDVVEEEWTMFISAVNLTDNIVDIVSKTVHEFTHLYRFGGIVENENEAKIKDGISVARYNKNTKVMKRKHFNIEEGIVEDYTASTMYLFYDLIKTEDVSFSPALSNFKEKFTADYKAMYPIQRFYLDGLARNKRFKELLDNTFYDTTEPLQLVSYFNDVVGDPTAFTTFSRGLDRLMECAYNSNNNVYTGNLSNDLIEQVNCFLAGKKHQ